MILTPNNFSKNLKLCVRYFFRTKSKIVRVTSRSICAGMPHIYSINIFNNNFTKIKVNKKVYAGFETKIKN